MAGRKDRFDWITFALYGSLVLTGWLMLYAVGYGELLEGRFSLNSNIGRQTIWIGISLFAFILTQVIDDRFWRTFAYPIYILSIFLLLLVLIVGSEVKGATSWIAIGGFSFQPSELAKFATLLALCTYLGFTEMRLKDPQSQLTAIGLIGVPALLILLQPDAGSAMVFASFFILLFREGMPPGYYAFGIYAAVCLIAGFIFPVEAVLLVVVTGAAVIMATVVKQKWVGLSSAGLLLFINSAYAFGLPISFLVLALINILVIGVLMFMVWAARQRQMILSIPLIIVIGGGITVMANFVFNQVLKPHQQDRINVWLQPDKCDPQGALYNIIQSKVAIGSGGFSGKGWLEGSMTKLNFVPEQSTDFIFSTIGEEQGFLGSAVVILLFIGLIMRIVYLGERSENLYLRHFAYGLGGMLFFHFFVNIGMTMGLVPVVGIPLPFISKGGTALLTFTIMISVFLRMAKSRF